MPDGSLWHVIAMLICLAFSSFFSSSETAFTSFNKTKMKSAAAEGDKKAALVLKMSENYDKLLSTILVGNNIVNIAISSIATVWFIDLLKNRSSEATATAISTIVVTVVVLIFGEITPKSLAKDRPESLAKIIARPLRVIAFLLTPVNSIFSLWRKLINVIFKPSEKNVITEGEVLTLVDEAHEDGSIDEYNKEFIENIFEFDDMTAGEIATHRTNITMLSTEDSDEEWEEIIRNSRFSRYPVYGESFDEIVGILNVKEYFRLEDKSRKNIMEKAIHPAYLVPETVKADVLFKNMREGKETIAIVLDEYGGLHGIVTITDLIECLLGEFNEPEDVVDETEDIESIGENLWTISGTASISSVEDALEIKLEDAESDTFSGYVLGLYGAVPEDGSTFEISTDTLDITINSIKEHKIERATVKIITESEEEATSK